MKRRSLVTTFAVIAVLWGCGRKAPPLPPIVEVPETTTNLSAYQEGLEVVLSWTFPQLTRGGSALVDLARIEVFRLVVPPGQEGVAAGPAGEELRRQLMLGRGTVIARLEGDALRKATRGDALEYRDTIIEVTDGATPSTLWYAVRSRRRDGTPSALSNIVSWLPRQVPPEVKDLAAKVTAQAIELSWSPVAGAGYVVERRAASGGTWSIVSPIGIEQPTFVDTKAKQGESWRYRVRTFVKLAVNPPGKELEVPYPDIYPPPPVASFVCLPETDAVRLRWEASPEAGVRYRVARRHGGEWEKVGDGIATTDLTDKAPPSGVVEYSVRAVDAAGNESTTVTCTVRMGT